MRDALCYLPTFMLYFIIFCFKAAASFYDLYKVNQKSKYFPECIYSRLSKKVNRISLHNLYDVRGKERPKLTSRSFLAVC